MSEILLKLHYDWHELKKHQDIKLVDFVKEIEKNFDKQIATYYYKLSLADQLAASITRIHIKPTFSRYTIKYDLNDKFDFLSLSQRLINLDSVFKLWKIVINSPELNLLNESLEYGDQPLSTHLLLTMAFGSHFIRNKKAYILVKIFPQKLNSFIQGFWYKIFQIIQNKFLYMF